jgi:hypothetical protein
LREVEFRKDSDNGSFIAGRLSDELVIWDYLEKVSSRNEVKKSISPWDFSCYASFEERSLRLIRYMC